MEIHSVCEPYEKGKLFIELNDESYLIGWAFIVIMRMVNLK